MENKGLRFNKGKIRRDLVPDSLIQGVAQVLTYGAEKYTVYDSEGNVVSTGDNNWRKGLDWMGVYASAMRHLGKWANGEDYDTDPNCPECKEGAFCKTHSGEMHIDLAITNLAFLKEFYRIYPQGDNRRHHYVRTPNIGLDIDEVLTKWIDAYKKFYKFKDDHEFQSWSLHYDIIGQFNNDLTDEFYASLEPKIKPSDLHFEPHCYVTSRNIDTKVTEAWIHKHGFPCRPVISVGLNESKVEACKKAGVEWFIDDVYKNFVELNKGGICCFLLDAPHNRRFHVGYKRLKSIGDLKI